jgi:hypothetical protein
MWGEVELEPEVKAWLRELDDAAFGRMAAYIDLLAEWGPLLDEPHSRQLRGKLRELRIYLRSEHIRITYFITTARRIVLLTVFTKRQRREQAEIDRAWRAMQACIAAGHTAEEDPDAEAGA